jgi:hypothetical protein
MFDFCAAWMVVVGILSGSPPDPFTVVKVDMLVLKATGLKVPLVKSSKSVLSSPSSLKEVLATTPETRKIRKLTWVMPCTSINTKVPLLGGVVQETTASVALLIAVTVTAAPGASDIKTFTFVHVEILAIATPY